MDSLIVADPDMDNGDVAMEDGEISGDDEVGTADTEEIGFKRERHVSGNLFPPLDEEKLKKRAERFGINPADTTRATPVEKEQMRQLYESLDLPEEEISAVLETEALSHTFNHRFEAIHLRGTEEMSTQDVFDYFKGYAPASIEWINDYSCNVVWLEPWQSARAMLERSNRVINTHPSRDLVVPRIVEGAEAMEHEEEPAALKKPTEETAIPPIPLPPGVWRQGFEYPLAKALMMRFATRADRKVKGAERLSNYYRSFGNPNFGGMTGLISSSRKRRLRGKADPPASVDSKNPWGNLAEAWGAGEPDETPLYSLEVEEKRPTGTNLPTALVRRLGHQPPRPSPSRSRDTDSEGSEEDSVQHSDSDGSRSSHSMQLEGGGRSKKKRPRMRMYADEEEERSRRKQIQQKLKEADDELNGSRPVHARLGPSLTSDRLITSPTHGIDLRHRLTSKSPIDPDEDESEEDRPIVDRVALPDLRTKLKSRLGAK